MVAQPIRRSWRGGGAPACSVPGLWYLRLVTYGVLAGSTEMIQDIGLVGAREMYNSLGVPMPGMVSCQMHEGGFTVSSLRTASEADGLFRFLDSGMQTST